MASPSSAVAAAAVSAAAAEACRSLFISFIAERRSRASAVSRAFSAPTWATATATATSSSACSARSQIFGPSTSP